ncbi:hypothetical protein MMC31_006853 [Peltigera leucophlebia]|nr:hypothetical protein [Peltigera leucophlebia]
MEVVLGVHHTLSNEDVDFTEGELTWRLYTAAETLPTTNGFRSLIGKEFASAPLDLTEEAFVVQMAFPTLKMSIHLASFISKTSIHSAREAQFALLNPEERRCLFEKVSYGASGAHRHQRSRYRPEKRLTSKPISLMGSSAEAFDCVSIIEASIT